MAAVQLRLGSENWEIFRSWELEVYRSTKPNISVIALLTSLRGEWNAIIDKLTYAKALYKLQESTRELEIDSIRVSGRRLTVDNIKGRNPAWTRYRDPLRAYEKLVESFDRYIERLRDHIRCIQAVKREQSMLNMAGTPSGNEQSWRYTTKLLNDTKARTKDVSSQLAEYKSWLRGDSTSHFSGRDDRPTEANDDDDGRTGRSDQNQKDSGAVGRNANVANRFSRAYVSATGGANVGTGAGDDGNGGDDDDRRGNKRKQPDSKPSVGNVDEVEEDEEEDKEDEEEEIDAQETPAPHGNGASKTPSGDADGSPDVERSGAHISDDGGGPNPLDDLEEVVRQRAAELEEQAHQPPEQLSPLLDYTFYADQEQPALAPVISQRPGADGYDARVIAGSGQTFLLREGNQYQSSKAQKRMAAAAGGPEDPDGSSSGSDGIPSRPRNSRKGRSKSSSKDKGKRPSEDAANDTGSSRSSVKRRKQEKTEKEAASTNDPTADLDDLPYHALEYIEAVMQPDRHRPLSSEALNAFVKRLCGVFGEDDWHLVQEIEYYFDEHGTELRDEAAWQILERREFAKRWKSIIANIPVGNRASWQEQYERLEKAGAWHAIPLPDFGSAQGDLQQLKFWVVEAENPKIAEAWIEHVAHYREKYGDDVADGEHNVWEAEVERVIKQGGVPDSPPPLPGNLEDSPDLLKDKARRFGFAGYAPGVWNFVETLGVGGYGHAGLWIKYNPSGKILDRQVIKETYLDPRSWLKENYWMPPKGARAIPREHWIGETLATCEQAFNILGPSKFTLHPTQRMYRLYMAFCPHGDLFGLMNAHGAFEASGYRDQDGRGLRSPVPISVVWCVFEALASAACLMKNGDLPGENREDWDTIYHRDIKLLNSMSPLTWNDRMELTRFIVFLDFPDQNVWKNIPVPRLADFGIAMEHTPGNVPPPNENSRGVGTPRYRAPECEECECHRILVHHPYTSAGDVFSIGQTIWALMARRHPKQYRFDYDVGPRDLPGSAQSFYPEQMRNLVKLCLQSQPDERIPAEQLWCLIQEEVTKFNGLKGLPLKSRGLAEDETLHLKPDMYVSWAR